jgi:hypothetical protein
MFNQKVQALDFVETPNGSIALVTETDGNRRSSIAYIKGDGISAWWDCDELRVIGSLPHLLAKEMSHPFGGGGRHADSTFGARFKEALAEKDWIPSPSMEPEEDLDQDDESD